MKICLTCNIPKDSKDFYSEKSNICKSCKKEYAKNYEERNKSKVLNNKKLYRERNKDKLDLYMKNYRKEYYEKNKEKLCKDTKIWREENAEFYKSIKRKYYKENKEDFAKRQKNLLRNSIIFKISQNCRGRVRYAIKAKNSIKKNKTFDLIGCTPEQLKQYLQSKFLPTMTWENYGKYWHIDHIKPCNSFDLTKEEEQRKCFNFSNLQPLFKITQIINGIKYLGNLNKNRYEDNNKQS